MSPDTFTGETGATRERRAIIDDTASMIAPKDAVPGL